MTKNTLYHGTSFENYQSILENGFNGDRDTIWNCSNDSYTYLWDVKKIGKGEQLDKEDAINQAIQQAFESARIAAAVQKSHSDKIIVFEIEIDSKFVTDDDSCENMSYASKVYNQDLEECGKIKNVYYMEFSPHMILFYLSGLVSNDYMDLYDNFTQYEINLMEKIGQSQDLSSFWEDIYSEGWYNIEE
jgi:hypothetical protein